MIVNGMPLLMAAPIVEMFNLKVQAEPTSYGLTECGYDIRIKQDIRFIPNGNGMIASILEPHMSRPEQKHTNFLLASSIEEFQMPNNLMGQVLNKSTWARKGLDASMTTNIEPGWNGFLTLELIYHGREDLHIPAGSGIAQVMFHEIMEPRVYEGKYQNQADKPVDAITKDLLSMSNAEHVEQALSQGPVLIMDGKGVYPNNLDRAVGEERHYYKRDQPDPTKRGFTPK